MQNVKDEIEEYKTLISEHRKNNIHNMLRGPYVCPICKKDQLYSTKVKTDDGKYVFIFECKNKHCNSTFKEHDAQGSIIDAYNRLIDRVG